MQAHPTRSVSLTLPNSAWSLSYISLFLMSTGPAGLRDCEARAWQAIQLLNVHKVNDKVIVSNIYLALLSRTSSSIITTAPILKEHSNFTDAIPADLCHQESRAFSVFGHAEVPSTSARCLGVRSSAVRLFNIFERCTLLTGFGFRAILCASDCTSRGRGL